MAMFAVASCRAYSDLGIPCAMVKRDPNVDGGRLFVTNREVQAGAANDFVSIGSTECEDYVCVRDSDYRPPEGGALDPNATALGYCSRNCILGDSCASFSSALDGDRRTRMTCRPLLLNADTLRAICTGSEADRARCESLGNSTSPNFCARAPANPDSGT